jgi:hypothetical protein
MFAMTQIADRSGRLVGSANLGSERGVMARVITIEELKSARDRYAEEIRKLEEAGPNPQYRITAAQISRLIETLEVLRDQCTAMISSYGNDK